MTDAAVVASMGVVGTLIATFGTVIVAMLNSNHQAMNGRLKELLEVTRQSSHAQGMKDQKDSEKQ